jgi:TPR repeat protein
MSDDHEDVCLYMLDAVQGNARAQCGIALLYHYGCSGFSQDQREAARLYQIAADLGHACALSNLGRCYKKARGGLLQDGREAARQRQASEQERRSQRQDDEREWEGDERLRLWRQEEQDRRLDVSSGEMTIAQALEVLGISSGETKQGVRVRYHQLIKCLHPDVGGSAYLARQLNAARDLLLNQP